MLDDCAAFFDSGSNSSDRCCVCDFVVFFLCIKAIFRLMR